MAKVTITLEDTAVDGEVDTIVDFDPKPEIGVVPTAAQGLAILVMQAIEKHTDDLGGGLFREMG